MSNTQAGRSDLLAWRESKGDNWFSSDENLARVLRTRLGDDAYEADRGRLERAGAMVASELAPLQLVTSADENLPRLERFDGVGVRTEEIVFHPSYHEAGRLIWDTGVMSDYSDPGRETTQMALFYLVSQPGENGHNCPLACTAGMIKILQNHGSEDQKQRYLPGLLDRDYSKRIHASQFLTEVQGGSDVGANAVAARKDDEGHWRIYGEKWFCSVIDAQLFLMTARPDGAPQGTRGLGVFVVPREVDGHVNDFNVRRLKRKLGTRAMASAETDFVGARAEQIGDLERGFKNVVEIVLNTSRVFNAISCAGSMRAAYREASSYAHHRRAFGKTIADYPLVRESLALLRAESMAATASSFRLTRYADEFARGEGDDTKRGAWRVGVNVNKYWTSVRNTQMARTAMEVLGGNGAIETFSSVVQLYRDAMVLESWEGTHNVLVAQVMKDSQKLGLHLAFLTELNESLKRLSLPEDEDLVSETRAGLDGIAQAFERMASGEGDQRFARRVVDQCAVGLQLVSMLEELARFPDDSVKRGAIRLIADTHLVREIPVPAPLPAGLLS